MTGMEAQAPKSPPFAKGGLGGFYTSTYTYTYTYTPPATAANLMRRGTPLAGGCVAGEAAWRESGAGEIPPTPLLRKGGF